MSSFLKKMDTQQVMELLPARLDENAKTMNEKLATREDMKADREQRKAEMEERMTATQAKTDGKLKEPREKMMQSTEEHQEVPRDDAVAIPVRGQKRRHRGRKRAAGRRGEPKELN
jgi:1,6-anhydro-N-acetylmuramate kinase